MHPAPPQNPARRGGTPLWVVLCLTFLCSVGSAVIYGGIFFLAKSQYGFTKGDNYGLALVFGLTYMPGALGAGPLLRILKRSGIAPRTALAALMIIMAAVCVLPWLVRRLADPASASHPWPLWTAIAVYSPVSGLMWPIIESFLAGGRTERELRAATGRFNVTWSSAIVITMFAMAPFVQPAPLEVIAVLGIVHVLCIGLIVRFAPIPAAHAEHHDHQRPIVYRRLLTFLRMLLPVSFMFNSALSPYMPDALAALGLPLGWQTPAAATWYTARVLTFLGMERWHGWHGRWSIPVFGALLLLASFAWLVLTPLIFPPPGPGLWLFLAGLVAFGIGVGVIYAAALYYAMEVGSSGVDAGGIHETLIGLGYAAGPVCGLAGIGAASAHWISSERSSLLTLALVSTIALAVGALALFRAFRVARRV